MSIQTFELCGLLDECDTAVLGIKISSFDLEKDFLFIGSDDGRILQFLVSYSLKFASEYISAEHINSRTLSSGKRISYVFCSCATSRLVVVSDGNMIVVDMEGLGTIQSASNRLKNITCVSLNESQISRGALNIEFAVGTTKKTIIVCSIAQDKLVILKQISLVDIPRAISIDSWFVVFAMSNAYYLLNVSQSNNPEVLFPMNDPEVVPFTKKIASGEFLLNGPNALGIFVSTDGVSSKPPLKWSPSTFSVAYSYPYVLALDEEFLTIHSVLDQIQKQSMPSPQWCFVKNTDGRVIIGSDRGLLLASPLSTERQIQSLVSESRTDEALTLLRNLEESSSRHSEDFFAFKRSVNQKCGMSKLRNFEFEDALDLLQNSDLEPECLLAMWPKYSRDLTALNGHKTLDIEEILRKFPGMRPQYCEFFLRYLLYYLENGLVWQDMVAHCNEVIIRLLCDFDPGRLCLLLGENYFKDLSLERGVTILSECKQFHCLALHHLNYGQEKEASQIWREVINGDISDVTFPGVSFFVGKVKDFTSSKEATDCTAWFLSKGFTEEAFEILSSRVEYIPHSPFYPVRICNKLLANRLDMQIRFLELISPMSDSNTNLFLLRCYLQICRSQLQYRPMMSEFLNTCRDLDFEEALKIIDTSYLSERIVIMRRLGRDNEALELILLELDDFSYALDYCERAFLESNFSKKLFSTFLRLYLADHRASEEDKKMNTVLMLRKHCTKFSPNELIDCLPADWSVSLIAPYLQKSLVCSSANALTQDLLKRAILKKVLTDKTAQIKFLKKYYILNDNATCAVCNGPFFEPQFFIYPNNSIVHASCYVETTLVSR